MQGQSTWSYTPYKPFLWETGDIYVCRVAPSKTAIHFEWLDIGETYTVFCRVRGEEAFSICGETSETAFDIDGLQTNTDYEFFVAAGEKKSRVRLARTGETVGTVVNYLHPEDDAYLFSGRYLCSPSLLRLPDSALLASMDVYATGMPQNLTLIFRSEDNGVTWSEPRRAPVSSPHGPCRLKDGTLLFVGSIVENGTYESDDYTKRIQMFKSTDDGATWQYLSHIPMPEGADQACHEPHAIQMANGDILVAVRYENTFTPVMKSLRVYTTISHDNGKTWEKSVLHERSARRAAPFAAAFLRRGGFGLFPPVGAYGPVCPGELRLWKDLDR